MKVVSRASTLFAVLLFAACGSSSNPTGPAGATIQGTLSGSGAQSASVSAPGAGVSATADAAGNFVLFGVPAGTSTLRVQGSGIDSTLTVAPAVDGEHRTISVSLSNGAAQEQHERSDSDFRGAITAITAPAITVAGRTITTTTTTTYTKAGATIAFTDLKVGDFVEIDGTIQADGSVIATSVDEVDHTPPVCGSADAGTPADGGSGGHDDDHGLSDDDLEGHHHGHPPCGGDHDVEFVGVLKAVSGQDLTVGSVTVHVASTTRIRKGQATIAIGDLKVGDQLRVEGDLQADQSVNARAIRDLVPGTPDLRIRISGPVAAVDATTAKTLTIGNIVITTDANTTFAGATKLADLAVGDRVAVVATLQTGGGLLASSVIRFGFPVPLVEAHGAVTAVGTDNLTIGTQQFSVSSLSFITKGPAVIALTDIKVGDLAEVHGLQRASGNPLATRIEITPAH